MVSYSLTTRYNEDWPETEINEQFNPDRTILKLSFIKRGSLGGEASTQKPTQATQDTTQNGKEIPTVYSLPELDLAIISLMKKEPNISQTAIATALNANINTLKYRVLKLKEKGIIEREGSSQKDDGSLNCKKQLHKTGLVFIRNKPLNSSSTQKMSFYICKVIKKSVTLVFIWWFVQRTESRLEIKCTIIIIEINGGFKMPSDPSELTVITKAKDLASYVLTVTEKSPKGGRGLCSEK